MSDNASSESPWPTWKIALAVGVPVAIAGVGLYYLTSKSGDTDSTTKSHGSPISRTEPEGSSSPQKQSTLEAKEQPTVATPPKSKFQEAQDIKTEGNRLFKQGDYEAAIKKYAEAIQVCPEQHKTEKATYHQNMAAAFEKMVPENWQGVVDECTAAINLNQRYVKALFRRAKAFEKLARKENALEDITTVCILEAFQNTSSMMYADGILKQIGREKAFEKFKNRTPLMPSPLFIKQYFDSFNDDLISSDLSDEQKAHAPHSGYIRARVAMEKQDYDDVIKQCSMDIEGADKSLEGVEAGEKPESVPTYLTEALLLRGTFHLLTGNSKEAKPDLERVIEMKNANPKLQANALIKRGSMSMQQQEPERAESDFNQAVKIDPGNCDVYHHRGQLHILLDKVPAALEDFDKCIELKPDFAMAHAQKCYTIYRQATSQQDVVKSQQAMDQFKHILEKWPNCSETYGLYAQAQTDGGNFEAADQLFQDAIKIEPDNATLYVHRGMLALQGRQNLDEAVSLISKALEIDGKCDFAHETMGTIEVQRGNLEKATKHFDVSIDYAKTELEMSHLYALQAAAIAQGNITVKYGLRPPTLSGPMV